MDIWKKAAEYNTHQKIASFSKIIDSMLPTVIPKGWGCEIIFASNNEYCGKILRFNAGGKTSMHFHAKKHETWYIMSGKFVVRCIDPKNAMKHDLTCVPNMTLVIPQNTIHQIEAIEPGDVYEVSTKDESIDSFRVEPGSSQLTK